MAKTRKAVVLVKRESTYGTDSAPTGAADAVQISNLTVTPFAGDNEQRGLLRQSLGAEGQIPVGTHVQVSFQVELAGSGTAGTPPAWSALIRACGMAETIVEDTSVAYKPVSDDFESVSIYVNRDGTLHKLLGARGTITLPLETKGLPRLEFTFTGLWADPAAAALPAADFSAFTTPLPVSNANTPTGRLHGFEAIIQGVTFNLGNSVVHRDLINKEIVEITDRQASGSIVLEAPAIGSRDYFSAAKTATTGALEIVHGRVAGNIITITAPAVQLLSPAYGDSDGTLTLEMDLSIQPVAGDDEIAITLT